MDDTKSRKVVVTDTVRDYERIRQAAKALADAWYGQNSIGCYVSDLDDALAAFNEPKEVS